MLSRQTLTIIGNSVEQFGKSYKTVGEVAYVNPITGEREDIDFRDNLWVWKEPFLPQIEVDDKGNETIAEPGHIYIMGCDTATGEGSDFSAIEVFDLIGGEQVAELRAKVRPKVFAKMIDDIGRWYNNGLSKHVSQQAQASRLEVQNGAPWICHHGTKQIVAE